jgi:hypothetical protein
MRETTADRPAGRPRERRLTAAAVRDPPVLAIAVLTVAGLGLRLFYLLHAGFLLSVAEYDDGPYFGSAVLLTHGMLPYRDFVLVQPPGITLLMVPAAFLARLTGTAGGLVAGRILTMLAGAASIPVTGLLVRHRNTLTTVIACGLMAVYPDAVAAAHTVLLEPWLVLFTLLGAVLLFNRDDLTASRRRLVLAGAALGFAGAIKVWAVVPAAVLLVVCLAAPPGPPGPAASPGWRRPGRVNRATAFAAGLAGGFLLTVAPFVVASPSGSYQDIVMTQIGAVGGEIRVGLLDRIYELVGVSDLVIAPNRQLAPVSSPLISLGWPPGAAVWAVTVILVLIVAGGPMLLTLARNHRLTGLEWFALTSLWLVTAIFLWPNEFYYHFAAFLAPFLALALALPLGRISPPANAARQSRRYWATAAAALLITIFAVIQARTESELRPTVPPRAIAVAKRLTPAGSCVVSDTATLLLLADRFGSGAPGCTVVLDGLGADLALSHGLTPATGAGTIPSVVRLWRQSFRHAQFLWLSRGYALRVPVSAALSEYIHRNFRLIYTDNYGDTLYERRTCCSPSGRG